MGWNVQITLKPGAADGATEVLGTEVASEPVAPADPNLGSGLWLYSADDDEDDVFVDLLPRA